MFSYPGPNRRGIRCVTELIMINTGRPETNLEVLNENKVPDALDTPFVC